MKIAYYRKKYGLTQGNLAELLEVKQTAISQWEKGKTMPKAELLPQLAKIFNCLIDDLFTQEEINCQSINSKIKNSLPKIKLGWDCFEELQEENYLFIDKSLLIKDLIDDETEVLLITRPYRFGKSLNLSMIKTYFEKSKYDKSFLFKNLKIWETGEKYLLEQGKYPVIFMNFKNIAGKNWEETLIGLKAIISEIYRDYRELKECLSSEDAFIFEKIEKGIGSQKEFELSLGNLTKYLKQYYGEKTIILIDEYEAPISRGYREGYSKEMIDFMKDFLDFGLKYNENLKKAIFVGVIGLAGEDLFSKLNNFRAYSVLDERYSPYFGFTEIEVRQMMRTYEVKHDFTEIINGHHGYAFGGIQDIYNPWDIVNLVHIPNKTTRPSWVNTEIESIIKEHLMKSKIEIKELFYRMVKEEKVRLPIVDHVTWNDLAKESDSLWSFLLYTGYLTVENVNSETLKNKTGEFYIPNLGMKEALERMIFTGLTESVGTSSGIEVILKAILTGDAETFSERLMDYMEKYFLCLGDKKDHSELMYQGFILGLLVYLEEDYYLSSNLEERIARTDLFMMPKSGDLSKNAAVLEFKKVNEERELEVKAKDILEGIRGRGYIEEAKKHGGEKIYFYGIEFCKQKMTLDIEISSI